MTATGAAHLAPYEQRAANLIDDDAEETTALHWPDVTPGAGELHLFLTEGE